MSLPGAGHTSLQHYDMGYNMGRRDGLFDNAYEQDFAYRAVEYTRGYWDGFKDGIVARGAAKAVS